jgi:hypothetical protein
LGLSGHEPTLGTPGPDDNSPLSGAAGNETLSVISHASFIPTADFDSWNASWIMLSEHSLATSICIRPTQVDVHSLSQFSFLDNFTKATGFVTSFQCGTKERRRSIIAEAVGSKSLDHLGSPAYHNLDLVTHWADITRLALVAYNDQDELDASVVAFLPKTHEIVSALREVSITKHQQNPIDMVWSTRLEALCYEFFHPISLQKYLVLFWSCWYPNWPAIHRPTFDVTGRSPALVATMALVGACLSPDDRDHATAQVWLDVVEEMVFRDRLFGDLEISKAWQISGSISLRKAHLDILQAAYCVCLYQTWEGCKKSKRRILRQRFSDLVHVSCLEV